MRPYALALLAAPALAAHRTARDAIESICTKNNIITTDDFILYNNLWGEEYATSGSECTYLDYVSGNSISWQTSWTWAGGADYVKSYPNAVLNVGAKQLSSITSIPTTWSWSYTGTDLKADVSYDAFFSTTASTTATHEYEVMVWLGVYGGIEPIGNADGPIASPTIGGRVWDLYKGPNDWTVFSFVARENVQDYSGDIMDFFNYLIDNEGVSSSLYLQTLGAGTEPMTGSDAWFTVAPYEISINA
ncbi:xyloglucan-specific endo-beta-1,4-glucanase A [Aspergillus brunneoviolaceus CBS 621.78]|uniref:xyloglucan-specific endo-beta-1,4-glucanase n=2 Tax=Aspergillus TaxID=5052 RepID=A0A8G1RNF6_9EURO|nr:xyloglucan-specific endo-beta-1,4-glucanase A [Aspergillus brunneoviolaceus CBS 621.78]XP_040798616.1 xyloglucan-specific endo-beta-1,4-glucanase A [Aspergillus fijiensis CBS 313.89]RAH45309.1 xyloglucan-specific endo-beta-1,4-glucanase A [Aspergillus brunneoviolaceus CBS 621.78]RAK74606.1 xyloglucan-specific endo-beta-1,4-glucanase A [Aspergillus fijiensis CBS 313.89]